MTKGRVRFSIQTRLMLLIGLVMSLLILGTSIFSYYNARNIVESGLTREAQMIAEDNAQSISQWFKSIEDEMYLFSIIPEVRSLNREEARKLMEAFLEGRPEYGGILLADTTGTATTVEGLTINIAARDYFIGALNTGGIVYSQPMVTQGTNVATIMLARPIYGPGGAAPVGVVAFSVTLDYLQSVAASMNLAGYGHGWLVNDSAVVVGHPDPEYIGSADLLAQEPDLKPIVDNMLKGNAGVDSYRLGKSTRLVAYAPISQNGWSIAVEADQEDVMRAVSRMRLSAVLMAVIALAAGFALAWGLAVSLTKPILELTDTAEKVSAGDLTEVVRVKRQDEIGSLASSFGEMIQNLRGIIESVKGSADQVLDTASQLSAATEETSASIEQVAASANNFSQTVSSMNNNVGEVTQSAASITSMASEGETALERTASQMQELRHSIQELAEIIESLEASSSEIEKIVQAISEIAEQTNLLSLNAAIEAARAGEHGRGFAVVAEEVRKLSEQSSSAAEEIRHLISEVQRKTKQAVDGMQKSEHNVDETTTVVGDSGRLLSTIIRGINEIADRIQDIGEDTKEIDIGAQEMAAATEEQSATVEEITTSVHGLSEMAEELQSVIGRFKV